MKQDEADAMHAELQELKGRLHELQEALAELRSTPQPSAPKNSKQPKVK